jgi:DNA-binding beta-propeller fold protein YncE
MKMFSWQVCGIVLATSSLLVGQQGTLAGPVTGFVFDASGRVLRPIQGIPGASLLGNTVSFGFDLAAVYVSPHQDSALVVGADQSLHFFLLNQGAPTEVSMGGISGVPERVVFSPSGTSAALFSSGTARVLTGLPNAPALVGSFHVPANRQTAPARPGAAGSRHMSASQALALSDDGIYMLSVAEGSARLLSIHGQNRSLFPAQADALVAFAAGGHDAAVMDSVTGLTLVRDAAGNAGTQVLAAPDEGLAGPAGLAFSPDETTLYVASATAQSVVAFNLAAASRTTIGCSCTPTTLVPLGNLFRLTELTGAPLWLLDGGLSPRTVFVPARVATAN